jgi:hypothetical protein
MAEDSQWKRQTVLIGGLVGAFLGAGTAYLLVQRAEREGKQLQLGTGEGIRLGMYVLGLLRQVSRLGDGQE